MGFVHLVFTKQMFFGSSFFYLSLFLFLDFWRVGVQKQNDEINMAESDVEFYTTLVFKVLWSPYCTVVMCILLGEMNLLLKAFECSFLPNCKVLCAISWAAEFYFYLSKKTPFYFDGNSFCLITPTPQRNALVLWGYDYSRVQIVFSTSAWFGLGSDSPSCTFVTRIANVCFYN